MNPLTWSQRVLERYMAGSDKYDLDDVRLAAARLVQEPGCAYTAWAVVELVIEARAVRLAAEVGVGSPG